MKKLKLKMDRVATAMKSDQHIIQSLSESILAGKQTIVNTWTWTTYVVMGTATLTGVLVIQNAFVLAKLRNLAILVTILERNIAQAAATTITLFQNRII